MIRQAIGEERTSHEEKVKSMLIIFFDIKAIVHKELILAGQSVNSAHKLHGSVISITGLGCGDSLKVIAWRRCCIALDTAWHCQGHSRFKFNQALCRSSVCMVLGHRTDCEQVICSSVVLHFLVVSGK
jgi:hypothetical protein